MVVFFLSWEYSGGFAKFNKLSICSSETSVFCKLSLSVCVWEGDCDMSFSGLKTAVSRSLEELDKQQGGLYERDVKDFSAGFQAAISDVLVGKSKRAIIEARKRSSDLKTFAIVLGVAANEQIRQNLSSVCSDLEVNFIAPPLELCTDNAAMIAYAAGELHDLGQEDDYSLSPWSRWPLDENANFLKGAGIKLDLKK